MITPTTTDRSVRAAQGSRPITRRHRAAPRRTARQQTRSHPVPNGRTNPIHLVREMTVGDQVVMGGGRRKDPRGRVHVIRRLSGAPAGGGIGGGVRLSDTRRNQGRAWLASAGRHEVRVLTARDQHHRVT